MMHPNNIHLAPTMMSGVQSKMASLTRKWICRIGEKVNIRCRTGLLLIAIVSGSFNRCSSARGIVYKTADANGKEVREFCQLETFRADCRSEDQVLSMVSASYGRMHLGRCVKRDWGYIGCAANVIAHLDQVCSGRRACSFHVADLNGNQPCPGDLAPYLEVVYECVTVVARPSSKCSAHAPITLTSESGYLASAVAIETGRGGVDCPWRIESLPGQRVNLTLVNFARASMTPGESVLQSTVAASRPRICFQLAVVREGSDPSRPVTECEGSRVRNSHVLTSSTNVIEIEMTMSKQLNVYFLFHYRFVGCPRPELHPGVWMTLEGDTAVLRCNATGLQGRIRCLGTRWEGHIVDNCSLPTPTVQGQTLNAHPFPYSILIVVSGGVALGVFLGGIVLVLSARTLKRRRRRLQVSRSTTLSSSSLPFNACCGRRSRPSYQSDTSGKTIVISCDLVAPMTSDALVHEGDRTCRTLDYHCCPYSDRPRWTCPRGQGVELEETEEDEEEQVERRRAGHRGYLGCQSKGSVRTVKRYGGGSERTQQTTRLG